MNNFLRNMEESAPEAPKNTSSTSTEKTINSITDLLKKDTPLMQLIEKIPFLAPLKSAIEELKKFFAKIGLDLWELKQEITGNSSSAQKSPKEDNSLRSKGSTKAEYATNKPLGKGIKLLEELTSEESNSLARRVFGDGPGTDLLIAMDKGTGMAIKRMIALGQHEGGLKFGRQNPDPKSGFNIGTFQIGGAGTSKADSEKKYRQCFEEGVKLAQKNGIQCQSFQDTPPAQRDLITHMWYIQSQRGGDATFAKLRDPNLKDSEVVRLMHKTIQGGIPAIGHSVVQQIANNRIDTSNFA